jgi:hypothetical protein
MLRLTLLAPDVVEAILDGKQPEVMHLDELTQAMPSGWEEQRHLSVYDTAIGRSQTNLMRPDPGG